jgi:hypothetical protein
MKRGGFNAGPPQFFRDMLSRVFRRDKNQDA